MSVDPSHLAQPRVRIEEAPPRRRVRRPRDLFRALLGVATVVLVVLVGSIAVGTATGLEQDLVGVTSGAPRLVLQLVTFLATAGVLVLPMVAALDLVLRRRSGQILDAIVGSAVSVVVTTLLTTWVTTQQPARILEALTKVLPDGTRSQSLNHVVAACVAFLVVAGIAGRTRLRIAGGLTLGAVLISSVLSGRVTLLSVVLSLLIGTTVGLFVRYGFGTYSTRPDGLAVAHALNQTGLGVTELVEQPDTPGEYRYYIATTDALHTYDVIVLDRDREGAGIARLVWRQLRTIGPASRTRAVSVRSTLEHDALASYALAQAGVSTPKLAAVTEIGEDAAVLAYVRPDARRLSELDADEITDALLAEIWHQHALMLRARIAHRGLTRDRILVTDDGHVQIADLRYAVVAASELQLRLDTTELLVSLALSTGSERAVGSGVMHLGSDEIAHALPLLQPIALAPSTRREAKRASGLLRDVRNQVIAATPSPPTEAAQLQRVSWRTAISLVGLAIAAYFLLTQLGRVNFETITSTVDWRWAGVAAFLSLLTYIGATLCLTGFVTEKISYVHTFIAQIAASFVNLLAPSSLGGAAMNARFLERSGLDPALAVATVGVSQVAAFTIHLLMLLLFGILAGSSEHTDVTPSQNLVIIVVLVLAAATIFLLLPVGRRLTQDRIRPLAGRVLPRLITVVQQPSRLVQGLSGNLLLNLSYVFCLVAAVRAYTDDSTIIAIGVVYLAGSAVGSVFPTPGGIGAVEAAIAAGLTAAGVDGSSAVSAVLLFRLVTFWIPILPGWLAFTWMQRKHLL